MTPTTLQCAGKLPAAATSVAVKICVSRIASPVRLAQLILGDPLPAAAAGNAAETIAANAVVASRFVGPKQNCRRPAVIRIASPPSNTGRAELVSVCLAGSAAKALGTPAYGQLWTRYAHQDRLSTMGQ